MTRLAASSSIASASLVLLWGCGRVDFDALVTPGDGRGIDIAADVPASSISFIAGTPLVQTDSSGNMPAATFASPPATGHTLIAYTWSYANSSQTSYPTINAIMDSGGNTWLRLVEVETVVGGCDATGSSAIAIYIALAITAAPDPFTVQVQPLGQAAQEVALYVAEYAGVTTFDQSTGFKTPGSPSPMTFTSGTTPITTGNNELVVSLASSCSGNPGTVTWTDNSGFTMRAQENTTSSREPGIAADKIVAAVGTYSDSWTVTFPVGPANPALGAIATLR